MQLGPKQKEWVDALRSGKYKQAKRALCVLNDDGEKTYCCLGLGCQINGIESIQMLPWLNQIRFAFNGQTDVSVEFAKIVKLKTNNGSPINETVKFIDYVRSVDPSFDFDSKSCLSGMNDSGWTFDQIANVIEKFPHAFFTESV